MAYITRRRWRGISCLWLPGLPTELREEQQGRREGNKSNRIKKGGEEQVTRCREGRWD